MGNLEATTEVSTYVFCSCDGVSGGDNDAFQIIVLARITSWVSMA